MMEKWNGIRVSSQDYEMLNSSMSEIDSLTERLNNTPAIEWQTVNMLTNKRRIACERIFRHIFNNHVYNSIITSDRLRVLKSIGEKCGVDFHMFSRQYYETEDLPTINIIK